MHTKQAKELRAAGVGDDKNCGCGQTPCKTYGKKKEMKNVNEGLGKKYMVKKVIPTIYNNPKIKNAVNAAAFGLGAAGVYAPLVGTQFAPKTTQKVMKGIVDKVKSVVPKKKEVKQEEYSDWRQELDEKCWPGYEKKGMKTMFGKRYPNCVKKSKKKK